MADAIANIEALVKALEGGSYNAAPGALVQGAALQVEDLSPVLYNTTFSDKHIKLQNMLEVDDVKSTLAQFDRQLSYGQFGGSAALEGNVGAESTSDFVRVVVPMCFYSHIRRVTLVANMVDTVDGKKAEERAAEDAAMKIAGDVEFDLFRGKADFSNGGVFDGNPLATPTLPNIPGMDIQIRQSDSMRNAQDLMFDEYGSDESVVLTAGGTLSQSMVEDAHVRSAMNMGSADKLIVDPIVLANYNKIAYTKERIILAGSPQDTQGISMRRQWVSGGVVEMESSRFLSGKTRPAPTRANGPATPTITVASAAVAGTTTPFLAGETFVYFVTAGNEVGESTASAAATATVGANGDVTTVTITSGGGVVRFYNVYRSPAGGTAAQAKYIGRVKAATTGTTVFTDLDNKTPGFVTGYLTQGDTMTIKQLAPYSRLKLAVTDLSMPEAHFRFLTLAVTIPRRNVLVDNLS